VEARVWVQHPRGRGGDREVSLREKNQEGSRRKSTKTKVRAEKKIREREMKGNSNWEGQL